MGESEGGRPAVEMMDFFLPALMVGARRTFPAGVWEKRKRATHSHQIPHADPAIPIPPLIPSKDPERPSNGPRQRRPISRPHAGHPACLLPRQGHRRQTSPRRPRQSTPFFSLSRSRSPSRNTADPFPRATAASHTFSVNQSPSDSHPVLISIQSTPTSARARIYIASTRIRRVKSCLTPAGFASASRLPRFRLLQQTGLAARSMALRRPSLVSSASRE